MTYEEMVAVLDEFTCEPYQIVIAKHPGTERPYLQAKLWRECVVTGDWGWGHGAKYDLSEHMVPEELVRKAFAACLAFSEHEVREHALWKGKAIFGPHISLDALLEVADQTRSRERTPA